MLPVISRHSLVLCVISLSLLELAFVNLILEAVDPTLFKRNTGPPVPSPRSNSVAGLELPIQILPFSLPKIRVLEFVTSSILNPTPSSDEISIF